MSYFLALIFFMYGGMHYFAYRKIRAAFRPPVVARILLAIFMLLMVLSPVIVRVLERKGLDAVAVPFAFIGYLWMGFLFLFFVIMLLLDLCRVLVRLGGRFFRGESVPWLFTHRPAFFLAFFLALGISFYGYNEAGAIRVEKVVVPTAKLPTTVKSFRIVQVSDVHLGLIVGRKRLGNIIRLIEKERPDLLVSTGDLLDGQTDGMAAMSRALDRVRPPFGKVAVTGNHEYYAGIADALSFMKRSGFTVLHGEMQDVPGLITVVGVDDPAGVTFGKGNVREEEILGKVPSGRFVLLLKHRPVVEKKSIGLFDLQLSGHIHGGQIFPFSMATYLFYPIKTGLSRITDSAWVYVSRGTGTWGPPIRFLAPPVVTVIDLININAEAQSVGGQRQSSRQRHENCPHTSDELVL